MAEELPDKVRKGRGAISNSSGRFDNTDRIAVDDGWWSEPEELGLKLNTIFTPDTNKTLITYNSSPDLPFDRSINPYRGCEHGCIYCFARPTHSYLGLSPGLDFETKIFFKANAAEVLKKELNSSKYVCKPIALGVNTDAYQPAEEKLVVTRNILEVLSEFNHPISIITKSSRVLRDLDILVPMSRLGLVSVMISVTTMNAKLARKMEPRASRPENRIATIQALNSEGIPTGVLVSPIIPAINDEEVENILDRCAKAGARQANHILLRLPFEVKKLFIDWLHRHYPQREKKVLSLVQDTRGGKLYDAKFGKRMTGTGPYAEMIANRFNIKCRQLGINYPSENWNLDCSKFKPIVKKGHQMKLF